MILDCRPLGNVFRSTLAALVLLVWTQATLAAEFHLKDGTVITLLKGWNHPEHGKLLRQMHKRACGPFGTVLGPESDRFHKDHFHFDVARHRGGPYCR